MADDRIREETITNFFLHTCLLRRQTNQDLTFGFSGCVELAGEKRHRADNVEYSYVPLTTGSVAEFYIEPMLSCVGDVDIMYHNSSQLALPEGHTPPTQLPAEFDSCVEVYEIVDSDFPGYVYLWSSCSLSECVGDGRYNAVQCERLLAVNSSSDSDSQHPLAHPSTSRHGPALVTTYYDMPLTLAASVFGLHRALSFRYVDIVYSMRCLSWPPQAADWPARHRNYNWPDSATVDCVVSNGCDVVGVAHPLCRQDERMCKHQWRLSFSRAEITLLNRWMPVQQIVYHMLRRFAKTEQLTGSTEAGTLSNYHIKTLMLWACELKSRSWWTDSPNLVRVCVELLYTLAAWLADSHCRHYFINSCNLFDAFKNSLYTQDTANELMSITRQIFCRWCIISYINECAQLCPSSVSCLLQDYFSRRRRDGMHRIFALQNALSAIVNSRLNMSPKLAYLQFFVTLLKVMDFISRKSLTLRSCLYWINGLAKTDQALRVCFTAAVFLHVAYKTTQGSLTDEMLDVLATVCLQSNDARHCLHARNSSMLSLHQAAILMKVVANNSCSTVQLIDIELSKAYLHHALRCKDSDRDSVYCLANVYLAVLYYTSRDYQMAIDHCSLVTRSQDHSQCRSLVVQGELLHRIDDQIDSVLGLTVFYQYIRADVLNEKQERRHVSVFTTELFAHYLHINFLSVTKCHQLPQTSLADECQQYRRRFCSLSKMFITDVIVFRFTNSTRFLSNDRLTMAGGGEIKSLIHPLLDTSKLVELLQLSAVEYLSVAVFDFDVLGLGNLTVTLDFKAAYAYKCGQYGACLQLSMHNVQTLIISRHDTYFCLPLIPEFIQLLDDDIVSFIGLALLAKSLHHCPNSVSLKHVCIHQLIMSLYLLAQCQIKLRHSVTSLARTLDYVWLTRSNIAQTVKDALNRLGLCTCFVIGQHVLKCVKQMLLRHLSVSHRR